MNWELALAGELWMIDCEQVACHWSSSILLVIEQIDDHKLMSFVRWGLIDHHSVWHIMWEGKTDHKKCNCRMIQLGLNFFDDVQMRDMPLIWVESQLWWGSSAFLAPIERHWMQISREKTLLYSRHNPNHW